MKSKKWKKKYKKLEKRYEDLSCEYFKLKLKDKGMPILTDEQITQVKNVFYEFGKKIKEASNSIDH